MSSSFWDGWICGTIVTCALTLVFSVALAGTGMKCDNAWANSGDSSYSLIKKCGEPDAHGAIYTDESRARLEVLYYERGGITHTVHIKNNVITHILMSRF